MIAVICELCGSGIISDEGKVNWFAVRSLDEFGWRVAVDCGFFSELVVEAIDPLIACRFGNE